MTTVLHLDDIYFKLPDGFEGHVPDALRLLADYMDGSRPQLPGVPVHEDDPWMTFLEVVTVGGRFYGTLGLNRLKTGELSLATKRDCAWEQLPLLKALDGTL